MRPHPGCRWFWRVSRGHPPHTRSFTSQTRWRGLRSCLHPRSTQRDSPCATVGPSQRALGLRGHTPPPRPHNVTRLIKKIRATDVGLPVITQFSNQSGSGTRPGTEVPIKPGGRRRQRIPPMGGDHLPSPGVTMSEEGRVQVDPGRKNRT